MVGDTAIPHQLPGIQVSIWEAKDATAVFDKTEIVHFSHWVTMLLTDPSAGVPVFQDVAVQYFALFCFCGFF